MKKILVVLLILAVSAGTVFAQVSGDPALKITGEVKTGLVFHQKGDGNTDSLDDGTLGFWHDDAGPIRANLGAEYTAENHGAKIVLLFKPGGSMSFDLDADGEKESWDVAMFTLDAAEVWGEVLNDMVKFTVGVTGSKWGTGGHLDKSSGDSNLAVEIKPIDGLNFGFTLGDRGGSWYGSNSSPYFGDSTILKADDLFKTFAGGVSYKSSFIDIYAGGAARPVNGDGNRAYLDAFIRPIGDPLTIEVGGIAYSLGEFGEKAEEIEKARIHATLFGTYKTDADNAGSLTVFGGGDLAYHLKKDAAIGWKGTLGVGYQLSDPLKIGLEGNIQSSAKAKNSFIDKNFIEDNGEGYVHKDADTAFKFEVKPNLTYKFASNAEIGFWYKLNVHAHEKDNLEHTVQVNFGWTF